MAIIEAERPGPKPKSAWKRAMSHIEITDDCWNWTGRLARGYGQLWLSDTMEPKYAMAHRYIYEALFGDIPEGKFLDHLCRNKSCVNPKHLEPVTHAENLKRAPLAPATINAAKTHCIRGHKFTVDNTYIRSDRPKSRNCRKCRQQLTLESLRRRMLV